MTVTRYVPPKRLARRAELLLALVVIGSHVLFWSMMSVPAWMRQETVLTVLGSGLALLYWGTPLVLALTVILSSAVDDIGVGSVLAVGGALVTLYVVGLSIYTLINPPEGGGVFFGHIFSSMAVFPFVLVVLLKRVLNRLFAQLWLHPGGVFSERN